ncbi:uncharacterized protein [Solanum lycopersicum]|uniref:uncharacterized protein n=1 Tax=Solanum lycopersicum TaxID=4081 RepID=UPI0037485B76
MATLLHHIQPWMQKLITECEARLERKMQQFTERKIAEVNQRLDAFELRVLARPAPPVDVSTLQAAVDSRRADIDTILEARVPESETPSVEPAEDTVLATLFTTSDIPSPPPQETVRARKKERREMKAARRASIVEEEAHQIRASQLAAGASISRTEETAGGLTDGAGVAKDTTEGVQIAEDVGFGKLDPPSC